MIQENNVTQGTFAVLRSWPGILFLCALTGLAGALIAAVPQSVFWLLGIVGVIGYALLTFARPFAAFVILVFLALTVWVSGIEVAFGISLMVGVGFVFAIIWLSQFIYRHTALVRVKEYRWLLGLIVVVILSALFNLGGPAGLSPVFTYLQVFVLFVFVINLATTPSRLHTLSIAIVASSTLLAFLVLLDQSGWLPAGLVREQTAGVLVGSSVEVATRTGGLWGDANFTALQLTIALPFVMEWWPMARHWIQQVLLLGVAAAIIAALASTFSIGGLIGLVTVLFIKALADSRRSIVFKIGRIVLGGILVLWILSVTFPDLYIQRVESKLTTILDAASTRNSDLVLQSASGRGDTWLAALRAISDAPLLGHGPGNAAVANAQYSILYGRQVSIGAHNMFLTVGSDLGLIGLVLFSGLLISAIAAVRDSLRTQLAETALQRTGRALFIALLAYAVQGLALDVHYLKLLWILFGMAMAYKRLSVIEKGVLPAARMPR